MVDDLIEWRPGSFTKNFSWGDRATGLVQLHEAIRVGFDGEMRDVPREEFRARVTSLERPDYVPLNFFLFNKIADGTDLLVADELVFQALTEGHSPRFDKLALFAFNFSYAGHWKGAKPYQRRPALWSFHYIADRVDREFHWDTQQVSADDIEHFLASHSEYTGRTTRKVATNLNYLYILGRLHDFATSAVERWWVDALFLALDRIVEDRLSDNVNTPDGQLGTLLMRSGFARVSGKRSLEKDLATKHLITLYAMCGGRDRFSDARVKDRTALALPDVEWLIANDTRPQGAVHPTNPRVLKSIPRACAMLARYAGFEVIDADELVNFDPEEFVRRHTKEAIARLNSKGVRPTMSAEDLLKITRGE